MMTEVSGRRRIFCSYIFVLIVCIAVLYVQHSSAATPEGCNESICGSVVSKCMLTQSCKCGPDPLKNNITCAKDCFYCLDYLYTECCSCVDVCRKENLSTFSLSLKSNVEDLPEPTPELFEMLMDSADSQGRWTTLTFPAHHTIIGLNKDIHFVRITPIPSNGTIDSTPTPININPTYDSSKDDDFNCTVSFMKSCMSLNKCRENCMSLGAASYRWFHDGCCQCVGNTCLNYGLNEGRCQQCPLSEELLNDSTNELDHEIVIQDPEGRTANAVPSSGPIKGPDSPNSLEAAPASASTTSAPPEPLGHLHKPDDNSLAVDSNL